MMQLRWSPRASADFDAIFEYIAADNEAAAIRTARTILAATRQIEQFPASGRKGKTRNSRELTVTGTPYIVLYTLLGDTAQLLSIRHGARR